MKTLVVVISHPEAAPILEMNWPWLRRSDCDIAVVNHANKPFFAVDPHARFNLSMGGPPDASPNKWLDRFIEVIDWCTWNSAADDYDHYIITESDSIFLRPAPDSLPFGICGTLAGYRSPGFFSPRFYHAPWCMDHDSAVEFVRRARIMLGYGLNEKGFIDRFLGAYEHVYGVEITNLAAGGRAYSRNTIEGEHIAEARECAKNPNCFFMHGIKTPAVLASVTGGLGL